MAALTDRQMERFLRPYLSLDGELEPASDALLGQLGVYLDLLLHWNDRTNLTAIRDPEEMVSRHFGESLFAGLLLKRRLHAEATVLDFGSGAGFPGVPIQLLNPKFRVTLAESQGKKAAFLREVVRVLGCGSEVWGARVETLPPTRTFDAVTLRAVDRMGEIAVLALRRVQDDGYLLELTSDRKQPGEYVSVPERNESYVRLRTAGAFGVPRGTMA